MAPGVTGKEEAPLAATGGASRESCGGLSRSLSSRPLAWAQWALLAGQIGPDRAVMLAALAYKGAGQ